MPIINTIIQPRSWILVRDRIGQILKDELANQAAITYNDYINCDVYVERWSPVNLNECIDTSVVIVGIESIKPENSTWIDRDDVVQYSIVTTTAMAASPTNGGDVNAMMRNQEITGIIDGILTHPEYITLAFPKPFIIRSKVVDIKFGMQNRQESAGMVSSVVTLEVSFDQSEPESTTTPLSESLTSVKINDTENGYKYEFNQQ